MYAIRSYYAGAFVSEIFGDEADELRRRGGDGGEYGATTGRPRRMGWFDCVASKYRITSYNVCYTKLLRICSSIKFT